MDETKVVSLTSPADMHAARIGPRYEAIGMPEGDIQAPWRALRVRLCLRARRYLFLYFMS